MKTDPDENPGQAAKALLVARRLGWRRVLLVVCFLGALLASWIWYDDSCFRRLVAQVEAAGGSVTLSRELPEPLFGWAVKFGVERRLRRFGAKSTILNVSRTDVGDEEFIKYAQLPGLHGIEADFSPIGDASVKAISHCRNIYFFTGASSRITDEGAQHLLKLTELSYIDLTDTLVTDKTIDSLTKLPTLFKIAVGGRAIQSLKPTSFEISPPANGKAYAFGESVDIKGSFIFPKQSPLWGLAVNGIMPSRAVVGFPGGTVTQNGSDYTYKHSFKPITQTTLRGSFDLVVTTETTVQPRVMYQLARIRIPIHSPGMD